jgi:hypothetical protein
MLYSVKFVPYPDSKFSETRQLLNSQAGEMHWQLNGQRRQQTTDITAIMSIESAIAQVPRIMVFIRRRMKTA